MHIKKIDNNKLEILISPKDLKENNMTTDDFMSSHSHRKALFYNIIKYVTEGSLKLSNCKYILESFSIPSIESFIITISKEPYIINKNKYKKLKLTSSVVAKFSCFNNLCAFCNVINFNVSSNLFYYNGFFYLTLKNKKLSDYMKLIILLKEFAQEYKNKVLFNENASIIIKNDAINLCKNLYIK